MIVLKLYVRNLLDSINAIKARFDTDGFAINPARDFAPRMFTLIFGWGVKVFTAGSYFFWIPIVAPMVGAVFAVFFYEFFIGNNLVQHDFKLIASS